MSLFFRLINKRKLYLEILKLEFNEKNRHNIIYYIGIHGLRKR